MPVKPRPDPKKAEAERLQAMVIDLLREEENKYCADCDAKGPRWSSWNLGVFLCIRCAGIHRNLGVHLSKVKSVNLDSWTGEQVQSVRVMGNAKARAVYEAELPDHFRRPATDQCLEQFIRAKYEHKRYILKDWIPPKVDVADLPKKGEIDRTSSNSRPQITSAVGQQGRLPSPGQGEGKSSLSQSNSLSPKENGSTTPPTFMKIPMVQSQQLADDFSLLDLSTPAPVASNNLSVMTGGGYESIMTQSAPDMNDLFGPIVSANPASPNAMLPPSSSAAAYSSSIAQSSQIMNTSSSLGDLATVLPTSLNSSDLIGNADSSKKSNVDIMALFGPSPSAATSMPMLPQQHQQMFMSPQQQFVGHQQPSMSQFGHQQQFPPAGFSQSAMGMRPQPMTMASPMMGNVQSSQQQQQFMMGFPNANQPVMNSATAAAFAAASPFATNPAMPSPPMMPAMNGGIPNFANFGAMGGTMPAFGVPQGAAPANPPQLSNSGNGGFDAFFGSTVPSAATASMHPVNNAPPSTKPMGNSTSLADLWQ